LCGSCSSHVEVKVHLPTSSVGRWIIGHGKGSGVDWATIEAQPLLMVLHMSINGSFLIGESPF